MSLPAKNRLRADKVDRLAIVDRPAVPDAQVVLFKRRSDEENKKKDMESSDKAIKVEKAVMDFNREFIYRATAAAVGVLEEGYWRTVYSDIAVGERKKEWKTLFGEFKSVMSDVIAEISPSETEKIEKADTPEEPTVKDMVDGFKRGLTMSAISDSFEYFRGQMGYLMLSLHAMPKGKDLLNKVIDMFEEHVSALGAGVFLKSKDQMTVEKIGRVISSARLAKLKAALHTLSEIIIEGEAFMRAEKGKEEDQMDIQEVLKALGESDLFKSIQKQLDAITGVLKEKGLLLTDEEKAKIAEVEKAKKDEAEKAKAEIEKKQKEEQEKAKKDAEEAEKKAKEAEEEKKKKDEAVNARLEKMEKGFAEFAKRMGLKTSLEVEGDGKSNKGGEDPFGKAVRG
jgi:hypothetical protein